ncbi:MAG: HPP family protein [Xanthobacteraceae bacterium]|nr:HPP family protein [Xanthobacteraceae bacterium]QYK46365.1 MAG: HPP family protein [Xanthobacteraceae bacterium]
MGPKTRIRVWTKSKVNYRDYRIHIRASIGALVGILITGYVTKIALGIDSMSAMDKMDAVALPLLIAPMGASAVLLFAASHSPLAQPWSIIGGNTIAAFVGVFTWMWLKDPIAASGIAVGASIGIMSLLGCLHPPSGAVALTAVLGGPAVHNLGYTFVLWPVGLNSLLLLIAALIFNNATGLRYPPKKMPAAAAPVSVPVPVQQPAELLPHAQKERAG